MRELHSHNVVAWCIAIVIVALTLQISGADAPMQKIVFRQGVDGYHTYRIPALLVTKAGTVIVICEGRKAGSGDAGDIDLLVKRSPDGGRTWEPQGLIYEEGGAAKVAIGNPCPVVDQESGTIWLPFCRDNNDVLITYSSDDGRTWAKPREITSDVKLPSWTWYATGPGVGIQMQSGRYKGRMVIPCDHRETATGKFMYSHAFYSDDRGKTWTLGGTVGLHTDESQVVELIDGRLLLNIRNYWGRDGKRPERGGRRALAYSENGGESWSEATFDSALIEPMCQASFVRYSRATGGKGRNRLLFSNPAHRSERVKMTVRLSYDEGKTWPVARQLHEGPSSYSCLTVLPDGAIGCIYEGGEDSRRQWLRFARFTLSWLTEGKDTGD